jgi:hypothetical protein
MATSLQKPEFLSRRGFYPLKPNSEKDWKLIIIIPKV